MIRPGMSHVINILSTKYVSRNVLPAVFTSKFTTTSDERRNSRGKDVQRTLLLLDNRSLLLPPSQPFMSQPLLSTRHAITHPSAPQLLSVGGSIQVQSNLRLASTGFQTPNPAQLACNLINMARCIDLNDLKDAPPPAFWVTVAYASAQLGIPFLELIGGYSSVLTHLQLYMAAASLAWSGGEKWGQTVSKLPNPAASWDTMNMSLMPTGLAVLGALLPPPLGFLTIAGGMIANLYCDLKSCVYPPWTMAAKFLVTLSSIVGLILALMAYVLFHNREKKKGRNEIPSSEGNVESDDGKDETDAGKK